MSSSAGNSEKLTHLVAYKNSLSDPKEAGIVMNMFGDHCEHFAESLFKEQKTFILSLS